jgi:streptogramin lyase
LNLLRVLHKSPYQLLLAVAAVAIIVSSQIQPAASLVMFEVAVPVLSAPRGVDVDTINGDPWFAASPVQKGLGHYLASTNTFVLYTRAQASSDPWGVTVIQNDVWFSDPGTDSIVHLDGTNFVDYNLAGGSDPQGISGGFISGNKKIYFTEFTSDRIGELDVASGVIREWQLAGGSGPRSIFFESSTRVWFTEFTSDKIGKLDPTGAGTITEYTLTTGRDPWGIAVDSLGNVWFAENAVARLGKLSFPGGLTKLEEFSLVTLGTVEPRDVAVDSFDNVWASLYQTGKIAKFDRGSNLVQEFATPTATSRPWGIAVGPGDVVWFGESETTVNRLGRITSSAHFVTSTRTAIPSATTTTTLSSTTPITTVINSAGATSAASVANTISTTGTASVTSTRSETVIVVGTVFLGTSTSYTTTVSGTLSTTITTTSLIISGSTSTITTQVTQTQTTTQTSTLTSTTQTRTTQVGTIVVNPPIPGFPVESILAGLLFGAAALHIIRRVRGRRI